MAQRAIRQNLPPDAVLIHQLVPERLRGTLAALYLLSMALGGAIGDPLNGALFDIAGAYRPMFLMMVFYAALAFMAVLRIPRGMGEAQPGGEASAHWVR